MKKFMLACQLTLVILSACSAQKIAFCYFSEPTSNTICAFMQANSFMDNPTAIESVKRVLQPLGLKPNFKIVPCDDIKNCAAITWSDGFRYIVYDEAFMNNIEKAAQTNWTSISILAHEVGHHLNGHTLIHSNLDSTRLEELEADEFSGFILAKLGASEAEATAAMQTITHPSCESETFSDHPCKEKRIAAILQGHRNAASKEKIELGISSGNVEKAVVEEFGGNKYGVNYCFYTCSFENFKLTIDFAKRTSSFSTTYKEAGLYNCPLETQATTELSGTSTYFTYDDQTRRIHVFYEQKKGPNFGLVFNFDGIVQSNSKVEGIFKIERPTFESFPGYTKEIPIVTHKE